MSKKILTRPIFNSDAPIFFWKKDDKSLRKHGMPKYVDNTMHTNYILFMFNNFSICIDTIQYGNIRFFYDGSII